MAVPWYEWLALMTREYLGSSVSEGGGVVRVAVADENVLTTVHNGRRSAARQVGLTVVELDAADAKLNLLHLVFLAGARAIDWNALTQGRLEALAAEAGYPRPEPGRRMGVGEIAEAQGVAPPLLQRALRSHITQKVWRDPALAQDFRRAMVALLDAQLTSESDTLRDGVLD